MAAIQKKSQKETYMDCQFVIWNQSYLIERMKQFRSKRGFDGTNKFKLLDIGCYNGRLWSFAKQLFVYSNYTGIDYQQKYLNNSFVKGGKDYRLQQCDITNGLPFADGEFDYIVSSEVLEHIEGQHYKFILEEVHRVLDDKGEATLGFPMITKDVEYHTVANELKSLGHVNFPCHEDFIALADSVGLELIRFDSGFTTSSSWTLPKHIKQHPHYKKLRDLLGTNVARAWAMIIEDDHTGGGFYTFKKKA